MTKADLATIIMANTDQYKKTHLKEMHLAELEKIAAPYITANAQEPAPTPSKMTVKEHEASGHTATPESAETVIEDTTATADKEGEAKPEPTGNIAVLQMIENAYEENKKLVKGPRMDKIEFRETVIEKVMTTLSGAEDMAEIRISVVAAINMLSADKAAFCPINDTEKLMLATIPKLSDFVDFDSVMDGKGFLAKVQEVHGVNVATSRALMVSLMRKRFYQIIGKQSGQKKTTIKLQSRGKRYLTQNGLYAEA